MLFFNSHFNYYPLSWVSHSRKLNNEIIRLHERSLRFMYNDNSSTFERLLTKDNSISMHDRNLQDLETEMLKVYKEQEPDTLQDVFSLNSEPVYNLRNKTHFATRLTRTVYYGDNWLRYLEQKLYELIPSDIKNTESVEVFENHIKN